MRFSIAFVFVSACFSMPPRPQLTGGDANGSNNDGSSGFAVADAAFGSVNVAFLTSVSFAATSFLGPGGAATSCDFIATQPGNHFGASSYVAWLASSDASASSRLGSARGWVRLDGLPVADRIEDLVAGNLMYPIAIDDAGSDHINDASGWVITGANPDGTAASTCDDYNANDPGSTSLTFGRSNGTTGTWTSAITAHCSVAAPFYCFSIDTNTVVKPPPVPNGAKLAFVTDGVFTPGGGIAAANQFCSSQAGGLGSNFVALLATSTTSASISASGIYVRPDDVTLGELGDSIITSINVTATKQFVSVPVWTGSTAFTSVGDATCNDWTSTSGSGEQASTLAGAAYFAGSGASCGSAAHLYCVQQ